MTEEQKTERKTLIANNKAMESAGVVRPEFVKNLLAREQAPKVGSTSPSTPSPTTPKPPAATKEKSPQT